MSKDSPFAFLHFSREREAERRERERKKGSWQVGATRGEEAYTYTWPPCRAVSRSEGSRKGGEGKRYKPRGPEGPSRSTCMELDGEGRERRGPRGDDSEN